MNRIIAAVLTVVLGLAIGVLSSGTAADAQPTCSEGTLTAAGKCEIQGDAPIQGAYTCPTDQPGVLLSGSFCYRLVDPLGGGGNSVQCPAGSFEDPDGRCRASVALVAGPLSCLTGYELVGSRCIRYVDPSCGSLGCRGKITLSYTVTCVGDGVSRVSLGAPTLINGAVVSFITVNGSAVVGADITAGTPITVVVTAERLSDEVVVTGPVVAPACGVAAPTSTPAPVVATATPVPATSVPPQSTAVPVEPTAVPTPAAEPTATQIPAAEPEPTATTVATAEPEPTVDTVAPVDDSADVDPGAAPEDVVPLSCPQGQVLADLRCVPLCSDATPGADCFDPASTRITIAPPPAPAAGTSAADTDDGLPIIPLALIAAATVILAPAAYVVVSKRFS